ncbi:MAG: glycosyltransferase family 4 protein [Cyanobacteria bacterium P01_A01_bin.45]
MLIGKANKDLNSDHLKTEYRQHLFIFLEIFEREGGIQSYVKDIFRAYNELEKSYQADVFLLRDSFIKDNPFASVDLKFHYFKSQSQQLGRMKIVAALVRYILQKRPSKVFCGHINLAILVQSICQPLGIPYVVLTYGKEVWKPLPKRYQNALANSSQIWAISRYSRDRACAANNLDPKKVRMLPCAINGDKFTPGNKSPELIAKYGLNNKKVLMTVARLWSGDIYKGVDVTIRALPKIVTAFPEVKYLVIGRGDDQPRLVQLAKDLEIADRVVFAGFVPTEELINHYRIADAYVMPSQEGFGIVYLEAMACGIPVVSGDDDGSADPLQDGKVGWRVPHRDSEAVASACIEILTGEDRRCDSTWLREQAIAKFSINALSQGLQQYIVT